MAAQYVIRCPICLTKAAVDKDVPVTHEIKCPGCQRFYKLRNALPAKTASSVLPARTRLPPRNGAEDRGPKTWVIVLGMVFLTVSSFEDYHGIDGPSFLSFYSWVFLGIWLGVVLLRWMWIDSKAITLTGFLLFEGIGGARLVEWLHQGTKRFGLLIIMMLIGGGLFFLRSEHLKSSGRRNSGCGSGGCGSGSGGGCDGGGCGGGCGGCGG